LKPQPRAFLLVVEVSSVSFQVTQQEFEVPIVIEGRIAFCVEDGNAEDAVEVVGADDVAVVAEEGELSSGLELRFDDGFKIGHDSDSLCEITTKPGQCRSSGVLKSRFAWTSGGVSEGRGKRRRPREY
jgi:hypothetical protein